jgi:hypothetical protein
MNRTSFDFAEKPITGTPLSTITLVERSPGGQRIEVPASEWQQEIQHELTRAEIEAEREELGADYGSLQTAYNKGRGRLLPKEQAVMRKYGWTGALDSKTRDMDPWLKEVMLRVSNDYSALKG